jgi:UDP-N-acetylmuramoylalanine--D-glutamate ligase
VTYINDSIATAPERVLAAMNAFTEPLVLLAGGRDKHLPWEEWADLALERARVVVGFGEATPIIEAALEQAEGRRQAGSASAELVIVNTLEQAVERAAELANPGEVVLLSPGGTSFDAFGDFEERGARFRELVVQL